MTGIIRLIINAGMVTICDMRMSDENRVQAGSQPHTGIQVPTFMFYQDLQENARLVFRETAVASRDE